MTEALRIPLDQIHPSKSNPRRTFDDQELAELAASIVQHGVVQPIKVRPHPTKNHGSYELVLGERRWRASQLAKVADIPAIVEELDDTAVLEQQIIENTQRVDVQPLEEAESYQLLLDKHGYTMERLIERTGRSRSHLYMRLQLLKLAPGVKKALASGKLPFAIARLAATLPTPKLQEQYVEDVLGTWKVKDGHELWAKQSEIRNVGVSHENITTDDDFEAIDDGVEENLRREPLSYRAAQALLHRKYSTRLSLAKFDPADATLYPEAGACTTCPHRSGNQPELFPDLSKPEDVCTNPPCFEKKTATRWKEAKLEAKHRGQEIVEGDDAKKVFNYDGSTTHNSAYVDPAAELPYNLQKTPGAKATWSKLLGKKLDEIPRVLVQDPSGAPRELIDQKKAVEVLRELGKIDKPEKPKPAKTTGPSEKAHYQKEQAKREINSSALTRVLELVGEKTSADISETRELAWLRWVGRAVVSAVGNAGSSGSAEYLETLGLQTYDGYAERIETAKGIGAVRALIVQLLVADNSDEVVGGYGDKTSKKLFEDALDLSGVDWDKALAAAKDAKKEKPAKKGGKKS